MSFLKVELNASQISEIHFHNSAYETGHIALKFSPRCDDLDRQTLFALLTDAKVIYNLQADHLIISDYKNCSAVMDLLKKIGLVTVEDFPQVGLVNQAVDKLIDQRNKLTLSQTATQAETNNFVADPYVSDILEHCHDFTMATSLLCCSFSQQLDKQKIATYLKHNNLKLDLVDSIEALWKMCHGQANLESTAMRMNNQIPTLLPQRINIAAFFKAELLKKFNALSDPDKFCMILSVNMFTPKNQKLLPLIDAKKIIIDALSDGPMANQVRPFFQGGWGLNGIGIMAERVFGEIKIMTNTGHDLGRMRALQIHFKSNIIAETLHRLEKLAPPPEMTQDNEITKSIQTNDFTAVDRLLVFDRKWLVRYIDNAEFSGNTALIIALKYASYLMTLKILREGGVMRGKPNPSKANISDVDLINMPTKHGAFTPVYVAIKSGSLVKLKLLLDHGCEVFSPCGPRHKKSEAYKGNFLENTTPLQLALDLYDEDKSTVHACMVSLLIAFGADAKLTAADGKTAQQIASTVQQNTETAVSNEINTQFAAVMTNVSLTFKVGIFEYLSWAIFHDSTSNQYYAQCKPFTHKPDAEKYLTMLQKQFSCAILKPCKEKFRLCVPDLEQRLIEVLPPVQNTTRNFK